MPVILTQEEEDEWLKPDMIEPERIEKFLDPFPSDKMKAWKISSLVNKPQNDFKEILKPIE
jgi:putative SOS response-associated peptidase YedK